MVKQLGMRKIMALALGQLGAMFMLSTLSLYTLRFYAPTESTGLPLLLPIGAIGIIQGLSVAFDALIDPWIASVSDNSRNPKGKRVPFMRMAAVPAGLFCALIFLAPASGQSWANVAWILAALLLYCMSRSFFDVNLKALVPEIIPDTFRRVRYFTTVAIFTTLGSLLISTAPTLVGMLQGGVGALAAWRISILIFPLLGVACMLISAFSIQETDYTQPAQAGEERIGIFRSLKGTLQNREFVTFMLGAMTFDFAIGVFNATLLFTIDLLLGLQASMTTVVFAVLTVVALLLYAPILRLLKRVGKRKMMLVSVATCAFIFLLVFFHGPVSNLLGAGTVAEGGMWAGMAGEGAQVGSIALLLIMGALFAYPQAVGSTVGSSMYADIAQYDHVISGKNRTGMFMAVASIIGVLPSTIVPAVVGLVIYVGSTNSMPTAQGVRITALVSIAFAAVAFCFYWRYNERKIFGVIAPQGAAGGG
ncbi:MAG: MFS transporter, partial [Clostridiales bacterium]|nr:MFS transporter [Clostridiales bacterium]